MLSRVINILKVRYPGVRFKFIDKNPITLLHDSIELDDDDDFLAYFLELLDSELKDTVVRRAVIEYDVLGEFDNFLSVDLEKPNVVRIRLDKIVENERSFSLTYSHRAADIHKAMSLSYSN